jgi:hypothetical protein
MPHQTGILTALKDWGLTVIEVPGWRTRGSSSFDPQGHVFHHDVVPDNPGTNDPIPQIIVNGRSDLRGPLAQFWLETDGDVHLCAAGRANHAGEGGWKGLNENAEVWGTEMNNLGVPSDLWPDEQLDAAYRLAACTAEFSDFPVANVCFHKEWAPDRKIDPHTLVGGAFRTAVKLQEKEGLMPGEVKEIKTFVAAKHRLRRDAEVKILQRQKLILEKLGATQAQLREIDNDIDTLLAEKDDV